MIHNSLNKRIIYRIVLFLFLFVRRDAYANSAAKNSGMSRPAGKLITASSSIGEVDRHCVGEQCGDYDVGKTVR